MENFTCLARVGEPGSVISTLLTAPVHSGYASKSAMTSMIAAGSAAMVRDADELSAMGEGYRRTGLPAHQLEHVGPSGALEMSDVDAFCPPAPGPRGERLVDVPEQRVRRATGVDVLEHAGPVHLQPGRHPVVAQHIDVRRDVGTQQVHRAQLLDPGGEVLCGPDEGLPDVVGGPHRAAGAGGPATHETEPVPAELDDLAVQAGQVVAGHLPPDVEHVDIAQRQQGGP